jgi:hypothetical protein
MEHLKIHQFINEAEGRRIIKMINSYEGKDMGIILENKEDKWYIIANEITEKYLGKGTQK